MKRLTSGIALMMLCSAGAVAADWSEVKGDDQVNFFVEFTGEVPKRCAMTGNLNEMEFKLAEERHAQNFEFKTWCNSYDTKARVMIDSHPFKNSNGDVIPMQYTFMGEEKTHVKGSGYEEVCITKDVKISNDIEQDMGDSHVLNIESQPQAGARWGQYDGSMYVVLYGH